MIRVLIERHVAESLESHYRDVARRILQSAVQAPGFISGESLHNLMDPNHCMIWSTWRSANDWQNWLNSDHRKTMMQEMGPLLDREEKFTLLEHGG